MSSERRAVSPFSAEIVEEVKELKENQDTTVTRVKVGPAAGSLLDLGIYPSDRWAGKDGSGHIPTGLPTMIPDWENTPKRKYGLGYGRGFAKEATDTFKVGRFADETLGTCPYPRFDKAELTNCSQVSQYRMTPRPKMNHVRFPVYLYAKSFHADTP